MKTLLIVILVGLLSACGGGSPDITTLSSQQEILNEINLVRTTNRICNGRSIPVAQPIEMSDGLLKSAQDHAEDMAKNNYLSRNSGVNGNNYILRINGYNLGLPFFNVDEVVSAGHSNAHELVMSMLVDTGSCLTIMNRTISKAGVGVATSNTSDYANYYTIDMGSL